METKALPSERLGPDECCPLCGGDNHCRIAKGHLYKNVCWCQEIVVPGTILNRLAADSVEPVCFCRPCLDTVARIAREFETTDAILAEIKRTIVKKSPLPADEDFYLDADGNTVFTAAYHLKRGNCCDNGCRHCPY